MRCTTLIAVTTLVSSCASPAPPAKAPVTGPSPEMQAFLAAHQSPDDSAMRAEAASITENAAAMRAVHAENGRQADQAREAGRALREQQALEEKDRRDRARAEYERKRIWVEQHCERRRVDVTREDDSKVVIDSDGQLHADTFTQSSTHFICPAYAPAEMKSFGRNPGQQP